MSLPRRFSTLPILFSRRLPSSSLPLHRTLHKGVDSTPPLRYTSVTEKVALYLGFVAVCMSYPTSVLLRLDSLRTLPPNELRPDVQALVDKKGARCKACNKIHPLGSCN